MQTICATGIRVSELRFFTVEEVTHGEVVVNSKAKARRILIPGKLRKLLLSYAGKHKIRSGVIFITRNGKPLDRKTIWAQMKGLCKTAEVNPTKVFPHNLRKLCARTFYDIEKDIAKLADILGHSSIDTTRIYIIRFAYILRAKRKKYMTEKFGLYGVYAAGVILRHSYIYSLSVLQIVQPCTRFGEIGL